MGDLWNQTRIASTFEYDIFGVLAYTRNSKTTSRMRMFYKSHDCSAIRDVYFLCYSWMRDANGDLHCQTRIEISFVQAICAYLHT